MKKKLFTLLTLLLCVCSGAWADVLLLEAQASVSAGGKFTNTNCTTSLAFSNDGAGTVANGWGSPLSTFNGTLKRTGSEQSITIGLDGTSASQIVIGGVSSGTSDRTLSTVKVGNTTLTANTDYTVTGSINGKTSMQRCTVDFTNTVADGSSVTFTFSGNVQYYYFEVTSGSSAEPTKTAKWDWQNNDLSEYNVNAVDGTKDITISELTMHICAAVEGTTVKLTDAGNYAQMNQNTEIRVPVQSITDVVTIVSYPGQYNYTVGGVAATADITNHTATMREVAQGYVSIVATATAYIYNVEVKQYAKDTAPALQSFTAGGTTYYADELEWIESPTNTFNTQINVASIPGSVSAQYAYVGTATLSSYTDGVATITATQDETTKTYVVTFAVSRTLIYDANGGTGEMANTIGAGNITLRPNTYTKDGFTFMGWATTKDKADAGTVDYEDGAVYTLSQDATLFAVWATLDYSFAPTASSGDISSGATVATSSGGKMVYNGLGTLKYSTTSGSNCIEFGGASGCAVTVSLDKVMQVGTVITLNYYTASASARGFHLANFEGTNKATFSQTAVGTYTSKYTVVANDGLAGSNVFIIKRNNNAYLNSVSVANCEQAVPVSVGAKGYATYCNANYTLDFTDTDIKAYIISCTDGSALTLTQKNKVAKNEPVLLYYSSKTSKTENIPVIADSEATEDNNNKLVAGDGNAHTWTEGTAEHYILYTGGAKPGFYRANNSTVAVGKAYLNLTGVSGSREFFSFFDDDTTGIDAVDVKNANVEVKSNVYYNLNGQRVTNPGKGLYIVNGKKVIMK